MPIVDVPTLRVDLPTPAAVQVTPGLADADKGSDSPSVGNWASTLDSPLLSGVASVTGTLGAAFRQNNIVGAGLAAEDRDPGQWDYSFKPYPSIKGTPYEQHWDRFVTARNEKHADAIKRQIDQETEDKRTLDGLPWYARVPAEITAGTLDLPSLIPGGAFVRGAKGGFSIARSALEVGAAAGLSSAVQETGLHAIQETRTGTESAVNIGASVFLGGLLGAGGAKLLSNAEWRAHVERINRDLSDAHGAEPPVPDGMVRLYRGETDFPNAPAGEKAVADWVKETPEYKATVEATGRWFVADRETAKYYNEKFGDGSGRLSYVDVPKADSERFLAANQTDAAKFSADGRAKEEYFVPSDVAAQRKPFVLEDELKLPDATANGGNPFSLGAASLEPHSLEQTSLYGKIAGAVGRATRFLNPALRLMQSPNTMAREIASNLFEMSTYIKGNADGLASNVAVTTLRKQWNAGLMKAAEETRDNWVAYRKRDGGIKRGEFEAEVGKAMRRGDEHAIPEVSAAAKAWRKHVFDPLKEAAIKAKLLPKDIEVDTATSYFSRLWQRGRLIAEQPQFEGVVRDWVVGNSPKWRQAFDAETATKSAKLKDEKLKEYQIERRLERDARFGDDQTIRSMADDIAREVFNKLTGRAGEGVRPEFITITARGPLAERTFNIPDELVERWLESNVVEVGRRYQRIMSADVELANKFGTPDMKEAFAKLDAAYDKLRAGVTDPKILKKLNDAQISDKKDLEGVRDLIRGIYGMGGDYAHVFRIANSLQYILKMGQIVLSSLTEPVRTAMAKGLIPFMQEGFKVFSAEGRAALKLSVEEAKLAGNINDRILAHRLSTLADITDFYGSRGPIEKFIDNATNVASTWNGIRLWTDGGKMLASTLIQNQILKGVEAFGKASAATKRYLAFLGIDESMADRIAKQFAEHGQKPDGVYVAGTAKWTDEVAQRHYYAALNKDLDSMVVTKGEGDTPLIANTPIGRLLLQFNTFNLASHQRILMRGLQENHARFIGTVVALSTMGMLQRYLAAAASNRLDKLPSMSENPGWWISEGLDASGLLNIPFQIANGVEKISGINPIKAPIKLGDQGNAQSARLANRNELGAVLGPSAGSLQDIGSVVGMGNNLVKGEEITKGQKSAATRLVPFNSYAGLRQLLNFVVNPPD